MEIIEILKKDYLNFPKFQSYEIYADNVYFADPLNSFQGVKRYQKMINFMNSFFSDMKLELHSIEQEAQIINTEWTLTMLSPLPWKPTISISGSSELMINDEQLIISHIDRWNISPWQMLLQNFQFTFSKIN